MITERAPRLGRGSIAVAMSSGLALTGTVVAVDGRLPAVAMASRLRQSTTTSLMGGNATGGATRAQEQTKRPTSDSSDTRVTTADERSLRLARTNAVSGSSRSETVSATAQARRQRDPNASGSHNHVAYGSRRTVTAAALGNTRRPSTSQQAASGPKVLAIAARYVGVPYRYGGTTPAGFDCSGYVEYVYAILGVSLPRTADQQMRAGVQVPRSHARPGDIVSFVSGDRVYHNGIYAGGGMMYDAPRTGKLVSKRAIWAATVVFTRVAKT